MPSLQNGSRLKGGNGMNTKLNQVNDWPKLAKEAKWSVSTLAKICGVSVRTIELHFLKAFKQAPKLWLLEQRLKEALCLLGDGLPVKETAAEIGYKHACHFSRDFKGHFGYSPTETRNSRPNSQLQDSHFGT
jgi:transcriptional regulator GlxA family with amidase domain